MFFCKNHTNLLEILWDFRTLLLPNYNHLKVNNSKNFVDRAKRLHTNTIEDTWSGLKKKFQYDLEQRLRLTTSYENLYEKEIMLTNYGAFL
jgi:hypothetical protein